MTRLSLRISKELDNRVQECADRLKMKKHALAQAAVEAAVEAIEKNDYQLAMPIKFDVTHVVVEKNISSYPPHREETALVEEPKPKKKNAG